MIIAVDGPAASGKGTLAAGLAAHFHLPHLDTGLLYRAVGLAVAEAVEAPEDKRAALLALIDKLSPGRSSRVRPPDDGELAATAVVRLAIDEGSAKIRSEPPGEIDKDRPWTPWTGTGPLALRAGPLRPVVGNEAPPPALPSWL